MIEIELHLYAGLRKYRPGISLDEGERLCLPEGSTARDLIAALKIPPGEVQTVFVNRRVMHPDVRLKPGDRVDLFPAIAGG